jgi:hypothetical protein
MNSGAGGSVGFCILLFQHALHSPMPLFKFVSRSIGLQQSIGLQPAVHRRFHPVSKPATDGKKEQLFVSQAYKDKCQEQQE